MRSYLASVVLVAMLGPGCGTTSDSAVPIQPLPLEDPVAIAAPGTATTSAPAPTPHPRASPTGAGADPSWGPPLDAVDLEDLPTSGIAIEVREPFVPGGSTDLRPLGVVLATVDGQILGHLPSATFEKSDLESAVTVLTGEPWHVALDGTRLLALSPSDPVAFSPYGCADFEDGLKACHRSATEAGKFPTLDRDGQELLGLTQWLAFLADDGVVWPDDPSEWENELTENIRGAWASEDHVAAQMSGACEQRWVALLHDGAMSAVSTGARSNAEVFVGWGASDQLVFLSIPGCGEFGSASVALLDVASNEVTQVLAGDVSLNAFLWHQPQS